MATKNTKKTVKKFPKYIIDLTNACSMRDVYLKMAEAKINKNLTPTELDVYTNDRLFCLTVIYGHEEQKKPNVFKRFWNWITRKK